MATRSSEDNGRGRSLRTPIGIATFVHLLKPHTFTSKSKNADAKPKTPQYSVLLVFTPEVEEELKSLKRAVIACLKENLGDEKYELLKKKKKLGLPWRDASEYEEYGEPFVEGNTMINFKTSASSEYPPPEVVDRKAKPIMSAKEVYAGCEMRVSYSVGFYDTDGNVGVSCYLKNAQVCGKGTRLTSSGSTAAEDFDALEGGDDDDDLADEADDLDDTPAPRGKAKPRRAAAEADDLL